MKRLLLIWLILAGCEKPDECMLTPTPDLVCVDCIDQQTHQAWIEAFCGAPDEADRFISDAREAARQKGIYLHCIKY